MACRKYYLLKYRNRFLEMATMASKETITTRKFKELDCLFDKVFF